MKGGVHWGNSFKAVQPTRIKGGNGDIGGGDLAADGEGAGHRKRRFEGEDH